ncbi:aconitase X swivel domain-containing protein [Solicola gregarius]|uniref:DUF126 domain-containing protein n=1 Tax=Solicola gregarius TaxID=2908642 RepID=A0AA46TF72_9ACTN|nr:DUF126 domain-containing protein [Solicola gregarius]UYM03458.1 DUF126 domain-containing protein [Solicola gregarius]
MTASSAELVGTVLHAGTGTGPLLKLDGPLSFWGGVDGAGQIIDRHHPQFGVSLRGRVLAMESGRGSSSSASVLAELLRTGNGPAAIVMARPDAIVTLGALVAAELYGCATPVVVLSREDYARVRGGVRTTVDASDDSARIAWT